MSLIGSTRGRACVSRAVTYFREDEGKLGVVMPKEGIVRNELRECLLCRCCFRFGRDLSDKNCKP